MVATEADATSPIATYGADDGNLPLLALKCVDAINVRAPDVVLQLMRVRSVRDNDS